MCPFANILVIFPHFFGIITFKFGCSEREKKIRDTATGGSVLASGLSRL